MQGSHFLRTAGLVALLLLWSACDEHNSATQNRFDKMAMAYCECTAPLIALNQEAEAAGEDHLNDYFQQLQTEYNKAKECAGTVVGQFGKLKAAELDSVMLQLQQQCPDLADKRDLLQELFGE